MKILHKGNTRKKVAGEVVEPRPDRRTANNKEAHLGVVAHALEKRRTDRNAPPPRLASEILSEKLQRSADEDATLAVAVAECVASVESAHANILREQVEIDQLREETRSIINVLLAA
jgi:hypothetical protein